MEETLPYVEELKAALRLLEIYHLTFEPNEPALASSLPNGCD